MKIGLSKNSGFALVVALVVITAIAGMLAYWWKGSGHFRGMTAVEIQRKTLRLEALRRLDNVKTQVASYISTQVQSLPAGTLINNNTFNTALASQLGFAASDFSVKCVAQGTTQDPSLGCTANPQEIPKTVEVTLHVRSEDKNTTVGLLATLAVQPPLLKNFAYLITNESGDRVTFAGGKFGGKVGIVFKNPDNDPDFLATRKIVFANKAPQDLIFEKTFMSNLTMDQFQYGLDPLPNMPTAPYEVGPVQFAQGVSQIPSAPSITQSFLDLSNGPNVIKQQTAASAVKASIIFGSGGNKCKIYIEEDVKQTTCTSTSSWSPNSHGGGGGDALPEGVDFQRKGLYPKMKPGDQIINPRQKQPWISLLMAAGTINPSGGAASTVGPEVANPVCTTTTVKKAYPGTEGYQAQNTNQVYYVNADTISITSQDGTSATVCANATFLLNGQTKFNKSILRGALSGDPQDTQANVAFVNLKGDNMIPADAKTLLTNRTLQDIRQNGTNQEREADTFRLEASLAALAPNKSALKVDGSLLTADGSDRRIGNLNTYGAFISDSFSPTRTLNIVGYQGDLLISGFTNVDFRYNPGVALAPPPGFDSSTNTNGWEATTTRIQFDYTSVEEALVSVGLQPSGQAQ